MKKSFTFVYLLLFLSAFTVSAAGWPPVTGAKVPGNAMEFPTKLEPVNSSLETMLNKGAEVVSSYVGQYGPVVTIKNNKHYIICILKGAGTGSDQNVATSKCYAMN
ncbi:hypothetical protein PCO86_03590 [Pectobacteriaceae bacterium CE70]|uniref:Uncharacterized protein n=1 Tax=Serratia sp. (strain ATCC 39006) TaxID=104623 RepID=A0A2I5TCF0_SERS3|nr:MULTISPECIES: hypothetical protein [Enterobacterales]WJV63167.1 hypothetical protein PCO87_03440 [Pectobacteriaceae bacterium C52]WJV67537.1 hypothetical protein PCO86_03590 [Pectobacteriaceae bacterium CE70]WJY11477.1 hypothetical protein PCO80_03370 [Pectobacteriaceae bacterium C80]AUH02223.1 hypothetical protein CWC46_21975 [Serratia sp. ATCC 39006]AUH06544.1 hypothetical protein Ser39006_021965 [Serratia sp. ATCC 39006]